MMGENRKSILILKSDKDSFENFYINHMQENNIKTVPIYRYNKRVALWILTIWMELLHLPFQWIWYGNWKKFLYKYDVVIVFDNISSWKVLSYINKKNPKARIIVWYWNMITKKNVIPGKYRKTCEVWSFDQQDCMRYKLQKNIQFYFHSEVRQDILPQYDAIFVGKDKGRWEVVMDMKRRLENCNLKLYINVVKDTSMIKKINIRNRRNKYERLLDYKEVLRIINESSCIIDVPQPGQTGLTVRTLEALFYKKKLISTNMSLRSYEFYRPENILIWNSECDNDTIIDFFRKPYKEIADVQFAFENWIDNFGL